MRDRDRRSQSACAAGTGHPPSACVGPATADAPARIDPAAGTGIPAGKGIAAGEGIASRERIAVGEKIIDIAGELGYDSPSAFTSMFKKQFGKTPSHFFR